MFDIFYIATKPALFPQAKKVTSIEEAREQSKTRYCWVLDGTNDYTDFDLTWEPHVWEHNQLHIWPSQHQENSGTYLVPKTIEDNNTNHPPLARDPSAIKIIYIIYKNDEAQDQMQTLIDQGFSLTGVHYMPGIVEHYQKIIQEPSWIISSLNDYTDFDFTWHPSEWNKDLVQVWPSQHQDTGDTYFVTPSETPANQDINYLDTTVTRSSTYPMVFLDHSNNEADAMFEHLSKLHNITRTRVIGEYFSLLKRIVRKSTDTYLWVVSSICDYSDFDFTWHPSEFQSKMLHVFPSNEQKFGDTFLINVQDFRDQMDKIELLEWYDTICFQDIVVKRIAMTIHLHLHDTQVEAVKSAIFQKMEDPAVFNDPLTVFATSIANITDTAFPTINLWRAKTRTITPLSPGGDVCIVPRDALSEVKTQLYDYKYIDKTKRNMIRSAPMDIVFMSNGEDCAQKNYDHLCKVAKGYKIHWVKDVAGRVESAREAARVSNTDWFFSVNAKLKVDRNFDWDWQPDRLQQSKHYIFYAYNPITTDTYGHMATIAWNKKLVNTDTDWGLDFTMSHEHEVIPILSGEAIYAGKSWDEWRTAFREVVKLRVDGSTESMERIDKWESTEDTNYWTYRGTRDAMFYYRECERYGMDKLQLTFEWEWLSKYYHMMYFA